MQSIDSNLASQGVLGCALRPAGRLARATSANNSGRSGASLCGNSLPLPAYIPQKASELHGMHQQTAVNDIMYQSDFFVDTA